MRVLSLVALALIAIAIIYVIISRPLSAKRSALDDTFYSGNLPALPVNDIPISRDGENYTQFNVPSTQMQMLQRAAFPAQRTYST